MSELLVEDLRRELARGRVIVLVGAGVSVAATGGVRVASWTGLLEDGVARCEQLALRPLPTGWGDRTRGQIESGDVEELLLAAEAVTGRLGGRDHGEYRRWLRETVGELNASHMEVLEALRDLGGILATTNYDGLLEKITGRPPVTWQDTARAQAVLRGDEQAIVHLHGFWQEPESVVLGVRSYEQLLGAEHAQAMQQAMAAMDTLLFVGFGAGLADPNFAALRDWMARLFRGSQYRHFRLAKHDEVDALRTEHSPDERVFVLGYGPTHEDLAPYLRQLAPGAPSPPPGEASPPPRTRPRGPGGLPPVWNLPFASNPNFTGRDTILDALQAGLTREQGMVHPQVIAGTGGVGKTQLAVEYAWQHRADYDVVWWVRAEIAASLHGDYAALAPEVGLGKDPNLDTMVTAVQAWLEDNQRWLVIFDNADDPGAIIPLLPRAGDGHVLVTSQQEDDLGMRADLIPLDVLTPEEATLFLLTRTGYNDLAAARQLADALGCLPLALEQAGAFIAQTKVITLARYLELFNQQSLKLLKRGGQKGSYRHTVDTTWDLSLQRLGQETPATTQVLNLFAFLAPDDLPWHLLANHPGELPATLPDAAEDEIALAEMIGALRRYSLVKVTGDGVSIHRLLQAVIRETLDDDAQQQWASAAIDLLRASFPRNSGDVRTWSECQRLLPHVLAATGHAQRLSVTVALEASSWLLDRAAEYLRGRAQFAQAKALFEQAQTIDETIYEPGDPALAGGIINLGNLLWSMGDLDGAKTQYERTLLLDDLDESNFGAASNNLGNVLWSMGDLDGAKVEHERALAIDEAAYGADHPTVATDRINISAVLRGLGDLDGAKTQAERALAIDEAAYGADHPEVATDRQVLGHVLLDMGDRDGAKAQYEQALASYMAALGPEHPKVTAVMADLARL